MNAITREDLLSFRASMQPGARGVKAIDALIARLTREQLEREVEAKAAWMDGDIDIEREMENFFRFNIDGVV